MPGYPELIDSYVERTFRTNFPAETVQWFINWDELKSVSGVEHFHVLLRDPDMSIVDKITNGDFPRGKMI